MLYIIILRLMYNGLCIDGLAQERRNSSVLTMELRLSCTDPTILLLICDDIDSLYQVSIVHNMVDGACHPVSCLWSTIPVPYQFRQLTAIPGRLICPGGHVSSLNKSNSLQFFWKMGVSKVCLLEVQQSVTKKTKVSFKSSRGQWVK